MSNTKKVIVNFCSRLYYIFVDKKHLSFLLFSRSIWRQWFIRKKLWSSQAWYNLALLSKNIQSPSEQSEPNTIGHVCQGLVLIIQNSYFASHRPCDSFSDFNTETDFIKIDNSKFNLIFLFYEFVSSLSLLCLYLKNIA